MRMAFCHTDGEITMHIEKSGIRAEPLLALTQIADVEHKLGGAPPTNSERELHDWVESFVNSKD
jgi:hypothetical protein